MRSGTEQSDRLPLALQPGYFSPDEFSLAQRLRMSYGLARELHFVNSSAQHAGHWGQLLAGDESVMLADLAAYPIDATIARFLAALPWTGIERSWPLVCRLCGLLDHWRKGLVDHPSGLRVADALKHAIENDVAPLLRACVQALGTTQVDLQGLHASWGVGLLTGTRVATNRGAVLAQLRKLALALGRAVRQVQAVAHEQLLISLQSQRHEPAMGLLLATVQLTQLSRGPLNRFADRLTDFYYLDVLRLRPSARPIEQVHLLLERDAALATEVRVEAGVVFLAGKDAQGSPIEYVADHGLELTRVRVAALLTLRLERDLLISPEREFGYASRVKAQSLPLQSAVDGDSARPKWWPLLGGHSKGSAGHALDARLGLALASPLLKLGQGQREVRLRLRTKHPAQRDRRLHDLLKQPLAQRDQAWLANVFARLEALESQDHPDADRPIDNPIGAVVTGQVDPAAMAQTVWQRGPLTQVDVLLCFLLQRCCVAGDATLFFRRLGRLFSSWLCAGSEDLRAVDVQALRAAASRWLEQVNAGAPAARPQIDDPLYLVCADEQAPPPERALVFDRIFRGLWRARLSVDEGWLDVPDVFVCRSAEADTDADPLGGSIELTLRLLPEHPAVRPCRSAVHGAMWPDQPVVQLHLQSQTRVHAYSLLQQIELRSIGLEVEVQGLRDLRVHNQLGRLDASKPFAPFGPIPTAQSFLILGSPELASKPVQAMSVQLKWGGLPTSAGGFESHYAGYPGRWDSDVFQARLSVLRDGQWQEGSGPALKLFAYPREQLRVPAERTLKFDGADLGRLHRPALVPDASAFQYDLQSRNGFFRLELAADPSGAAFGHSLYPRLLTEVLTRNARLKRQDPLPLEPYTPMIEQLSVNYRASQEIQLAADNHASCDERVFRLNPFGHDVIHPASAQQRTHALPRLSDDGNLYIGLTGDDPQGALNLYFQLRPDTAEQPWRPERAALRWSVWRADGWQVLPAHRQLADGTQGFLRSGIVTLDLPSGMSTDCPPLSDSLPDGQPGGLYWLRLSANWGFEFLAGLCGVHAHAIRATRRLGAHAQAGDEALPAGSITGPRHNVPGLRAVYQAGPSFGLRPVVPGLHGDAIDMLRRSASERLRHKNRVSTVWDHERLVLDRFPMVYKVKCIAHERAEQQPGMLLRHRPAGRRSPGSVMVVVVPAPRQGEQFDSTQAPRIDACVLEEIARDLRERASSSARIVVRNAAYERIQVRCSVSLAPAVHAGAMLRRLNRAIVEYISPWHDGGYTARFDWEVRAEHLEAHLRAFEGVQAVGQVSLLHIVRSDQDVFQLSDTARLPLVTRVTPAQSWSLVLPTRSHLISLSEDPASQPPRPTGVSALEVGNTFIIGRSSDVQ